MSALLTVDRLAKRFGAVTAIADVTLAVESNEFFALLGPSGCGKTTLLRMIAGFEPPDRGRIVLDGADITDHGPNRRPINLMFQSYALFPHMTAFGNVAYGLEMEGLRGAELKRRVQEALMLVQLEAHADRKPQQLSGGQRQRVALARALVKRPKLLLLDEPLGALDKKLRQLMQIELKRLQRDTGIAFLVVTHDQEEALSMADRIALLDQGQIVQLAQPRQLYEYPVNRFAATFIGQTNLFEGQRTAEGFFVPELGLFHAANEAEITVGRIATIAVRPERVQLSAQATSGALAGHVVGLAYLGQDIVAHVRLDGTAAMLIARLAASDPLYGQLQTGDTVFCLWKPEHARLLID